MESMNVGGSAESGLSGLAPAENVHVRTSKDKTRFYCPYPTCNRSFAELWRLKVHYRAPPNIRGSGKERGHGAELDICPKCMAVLKPGRHHVGCIGGKTSKRAMVAELSNNYAPKRSATQSSLLSEQSRLTGDMPVGMHNPDLMSHVPYSNACQAGYSNNPGLPCGSYHVQQRQRAVSDPAALNPNMISQVESDRAAGLPPLNTDSHPQHVQQHSLHYLLSSLPSSMPLSSLYGQSAMGSGNMPITSSYPMALSTSPTGQSTLLGSNPLAMGLVPHQCQQNSQQAAHQANDQGGLKLDSQSKPFQSHCHGGSSTNLLCSIPSGPVHSSQGQLGGAFGSFFDNMPPHSSNSLSTSLPPQSTAANMQGAQARNHVHDQNPGQYLFSHPNMTGIRPQSQQQSQEQAGKQDHQQQQQANMSALMGFSFLSHPHHRLSSGGDVSGAGGFDLGHMDQGMEKALAGLSNEQQWTLRTLINHNGSQFKRDVGGLYLT
eukprot:gene9196-16335_t